jgi:formyl-CoA transferase
METVGVACGPILSVDELVCDPYVEHRKMVRNLEAEGGGGEIAVVGSAIPTSDESFAVRPPFPGEHTDEILAELGFDAQGQV